MVDRVPYLDGRTILENSFSPREMGPKPHKILSPIEVVHFPRMDF